LLRMGQVLAGRPLFKHAAWIVCGRPRGISHQQANMVAQTLGSRVGPTAKSLLPPMVFMAMVHLRCKWSGSATVSRAHFRTVQGDPSFVVFAMLHVIARPQRSITEVQGNALDQHFGTSLSSCRVEPLSLPAHDSDTLP